MALKLRLEKTFYVLNLIGFDSLTQECVPNVNLIIYKLAN